MKSYGQVSVRLGEKDIKHWDQVVKLFKEASNDPASDAAVVRWMIAVVLNARGIPGDID